MINRGHRVYRGASVGGGDLPRVLLFLLVFLVLAGLLAFSLLPQYLVYHREGVEMIVPMLEEDGKGYTIEATTGPAPFAGDASASVQVAAPDYSNVNVANVSGMSYVNGYFVPLSRVTEAGLESAVKEATRSLSGLGVKGLVLEMKDGSGSLGWMSAVAMASSAGANSSWDPQATLAELKADGWYLVAKLSCSVDSLLAAKYPDYALRDTSGAVYTDGNGSWVDLWNRDVRQYAVDLCADLFAIGFDEIILTHVEHPVNNVRYTREIAADLSREAYVMNFSLAVRRGLDKELSAGGRRLCVQLNHDVLTAAGASNGQSLENMLRVYDRVVIPTGTYSEDAPIFTGLKYDSTLRFVPQMTWGFGGGSWILDPNAPESKF